MRLVMTLKIQPWLATWIEENRTTNFQHCLELAGSTRDILYMTIDGNPDQSLRNKIMFVAEAMLNGYEVGEYNESDNPSVG